MRPLRVAVERMGVGEKAATGLALILHELATNSLKYGALSVETGTLDISSTPTGPNIELTWLERGGPSVSTRPDLSGFGSKLVERSVAGQLGGSITYNWDSGGLTATLVMNRERLSL